jgi:hypothetical protein
MGAGDSAEERGGDEGKGFHDWGLFGGCRTLCRLLAKSAGRNIEKSEVNSAAAGAKAVFTLMRAHAFPFHHRPVT